MGGILELTEHLKSPIGLIAVVAVCAGAWYLWKWVTTDSDDQQ